MVIVYNHRYYHKVGMIMKGKMARMQLHRRANELGYTHVCIVEGHIS